jgi:hypothetical protein
VEVLETLGSTWGATLPDLGETIGDQLWNAFRVVVRSLEGYHVVVLRAADCLPPSLVSRLFAYAKAAHTLSVLCVFNAGGPRLRVEDGPYLDLKLRMEAYSLLELVAIVESRCRQAFSDPMLPDVSRFVVDAVAAFALRVPGVCMRVLQEIALLSEACPVVDADAIRGCVKRVVRDAHGSPDAWEFILESDLLERCFLEGLLGWFSANGGFYADYGELEGIYARVCMSLGLRPDLDEFAAILLTLEEWELLAPSEIELAALEWDNSDDSNALEECPSRVAYLLTDTVRELQEKMHHCFSAGRAE